MNLISKYAKKKVPVTKKVKNPNPFTIVAIGASAGGIEAVIELFNNLSSTTGMAYIYVQHLSPDHKSLLATLLSAKTKMVVQEIEEMEKIKPNNVYVIPHNKEIIVTDGHIQLIPRTKNRASKISIDLLFSSLALTHKENVIGVILSGNAHDGTKGLKDIKIAGGITFAQDDSAKFSSMPNSAIAEGVVDFILSPQEIAVELVRLSKQVYSVKSKSKFANEDRIKDDDKGLKTILTLLYKNKHIDFSHYKMNTIKRRIIRRMMIHKSSNLKTYVSLLTKNEGELSLLCKDLLINVTDFFRDPEAFNSLKKTILNKLIKTKKPGETLRIWVVACSTGEEVYSLAMLLFELQGNKDSSIPFQLFASDLSESAIKTARLGEYQNHQLKNISQKRLDQYFIKIKDKYRISQALRDVCIFAQHNILSDPPFSRMDFISCRNILIYLEPLAQKKVMSTLHYALNDGGYLMLGKSETVGSSSGLFTIVDKNYKFYSRKNNSGIRKIPELSPRLTNSRIPQKEISSPLNSKRNFYTSSGNVSNAFDAILLNKFAPASVIINHDMEILQFRGQTSAYLKQFSGKASFNILKMASSEITFELRNAIHHAIKTNKPVEKTGLEMHRDGIKKTLEIVNLEVVPLKIEEEDPMLLVVFTGQMINLNEQSLKGIKNTSPSKDKRIKKLEEELASARFDMGSITQDQETVNEELQSANEEVISSNEELQSLNEELETSKEEIESTNEELITTNQELQSRMFQVEELYSYYEGILSTMHEPMLILDPTIRIRSANASFCNTFGVKEIDIVGISLYHLKGQLWNIPKLRELLETVIPKNGHFQNFEIEFEMPPNGTKTMLLNAHYIQQPHKNENLIVLSLANITEVKRLSKELQLKEQLGLQLELEQEKKMMVKLEGNNIQLNEARQQAEVKTKLAETAVQAKQQFLSNMSHEIRTPLNAIIGFTNVILKTVLTEKQITYLNAIKTSGETLTSLINDILDLAKVDAGKMVFEKREFNLEESIDAMLHLFELKLLEKNLLLIKDYDTSIPKCLVGDPLRLHQIILNLISNAEKFTNAGTISISIKKLSEDEKQVNLQFTISDTGIGISKDHLEHIFENFEQASAGTSRMYGGTGLGLAIVKRLIEPQGGTISVESELGRGSSFCFTLSFEKSNAVLISNLETKLPLNNLKQIHVLLVEDVLLNQLLLKTLLNEYGFTHDSALNGKQAIEKLAQNKYDLILMDLQMPVMNGFEATDHIRNTLKLSIPIIALTADVTNVDLAKCKASGMDDYISKPIDDVLLLKKIESLVKTPLSII